jgi:CBS domain-containing protein
MSRDVVTVPREMSLQQAARVLRRAGVSGAPVVDGQGRCVGVLSAADFLRWAEEGCPAPGQGPTPTCPYQMNGRLLGGEEAVICTLGEGSCPLQAMRPATGGRHTAVCRQPHGVLCDWQQTEDLPGGMVGRRMTADVVTAAPWTRLPELARMMVDAHIHRVPIVDERGRPVGIVTATDVVAALAAEAARWEADGPEPAFGAAEEEPHELP